MLVHQILRAKGHHRDSVLSIGPERSVADAVALLSEKRVGALVVMAEGGRIVGILSERDVVRELGRRGDGCLQDKVSALMTAEIVSCAPDDLADQVLARMTAGRFRHMPVVRDGRVIGLISIGDVVKARLDELAMEKEALKGMIMGY
jgi:CBS domain-containing protein